MINNLKIIIIYSLLFLSSINMLGQSYNSDKIAAINYVKRVYNSTRFEGAKKIEGDDIVYYAVAISENKSVKDSANKIDLKFQNKAQLLAEQGFAEPCVKFEMVDKIESGQHNTYLFFCTTLSQFIIDYLKKKSTDGSKIISAPNNKYIVSFVTLDNSKYTSEEMRDKAAFMKAKQYVNTLVNGSIITSEQIIRTDENDSKTEVTNTEIIKEHSMGFIQGLELLLTEEIIPNKTTYIYYSKI